MLWSIISWILVGLIAGAIAKAIMPGRQGGGWLATILLGIVGAFVGGLVFSLLSGNGFDLSSPDFSIWGLIVAIIGALIVLAIYGWAQGRNTRA